MKKILALFCLAIGVIACDSRKEKKELVSEEVVIMRPDPMSDSVVVIEEDVWRIIKDEPENHMKKSFDSYLKKDVTLAASEIENVEAYIKLESKRADSLSLGKMNAILSDTKKMIGKIKGDAKVSEQELRNDFSKIHLGLALAHASIASGISKGAEKMKASEWYKSSLNHFENAAKWSGKNNGGVYVSVMKEAEILRQSISQKTTEGEIEALNQKIDQLTKILSEQK